MEKMEDRLSVKISRKNWLRLVINFFKTPYGFLLLGITILASFMRLYKISEYMTFLGDEGRDAIIAREILQGNLTLLGPRASAGDFFLGPIYYYMMAPFLGLFNYDPVGPAVMVAILGVLSVILVYCISERFFGKKAALVASALYSVSPVVIAFSRSSWNPNPVPFFMLLLIYTLYLSVNKNNIKLSLIVGILLGILLQLHYIAVFIGVITFIFVILGNLIKRRTSILKVYIYQLFSILFGFLLGLSPFLAFEIRHGFPNINKIFGFILIDNFNTEQTVNLSHFEIAREVLFRVYSRLLLNYPPIEQINRIENLHLQFLQIAAILLIVFSIIFLLLIKKRLVVLLMLSWLFVGVILFGFYKKEIYDYYYAFLFPVPFMLVGNLISKISNLRIGIKYLSSILAIVIFSLVFYQLISNNPFRHAPNNQKAQAERIAYTALDKTNGDPYNFALITQGNSDHVFRYFFEIENRPPVVIENDVIDPARKTVTDQLIVICDIECEPEGSSLWEVAGFGPAKIVGEWRVPFVTIYRLVHVEN